MFFKQKILHSDICSMRCITTYTRKHESLIPKEFAQRTISIGWTSRESRTPKTDAEKRGDARLVCCRITVTSHESS
jgi:hypothetical protein